MLLDKECLKWVISPNNYQKMRPMCLRTFFIGSLFLFERDIPVISQLPPKHSFHSLQLFSFLMLLLCSTQNEWVTKNLTGGCVLSVGNSARSMYHLPLSPPYTRTQLVCIREGSHTLHLLHPQTAQLMGVSSIVVLCLLHNFQHWPDSLH